MLQKIHEDIPIDELEEHIRHMKRNRRFKKEFEVLQFLYIYFYKVLPRAKNSALLVCSIVSLLYCVSY